MPDSWLPTMITPDPETGYGLAVKLSRVAVKMSQPDENISFKLLEDYENDFEALISISGVVATNFQTVAQANNYWRK